MPLKKQLFILYFLLSGCIYSKAQIEVAHISVKNFKATGLAGFLNFSVPVSEANYMTIEGGLQYFKNKYQEDLVLIPVLLGYRYTLNQSGTGFYAEPNAGYNFGASTIGKFNDLGAPVPDGNGGYAYEKVAGPAAGIGVGYLLEPSGRIQFNIGFRYEHGFGNTGTNILALRVSHAFIFGRRDR